MTGIRKWIVLVAALSLGSAEAGDWVPREEALKNLASGYAFMTLCSVHGFADTKAVAMLGEAYKRRMNPSSYEVFRDQYQRSLTKKRIYTIAGKRWIPFKIGRQECNTVDRSAEIYLSRLSPDHL